MLIALNLIQLVLYIALLSLLGQGLLYILAGQKRDTNFFYKLFQVLTKPFVATARKITPRQVSDQHVPFVAFFLLAIIYVVVTMEKIHLCIGQNMEGCR